MLATMAVWWRIDKLTYAGAENNVCIPQHFLHCLPLSLSKLLEDGGKGGVGGVSTVICHEYSMIVISDSTLRRSRTDAYKSRLFKRASKYIRQTETN